MLLVLSLKCSSGSHSGAAIVAPTVSGEFSLTMHHPGIINNPLFFGQNFMTLLTVLGACLMHVGADISHLFNNSVDGAHFRIILCFKCSEPGTFFHQIIAEGGHLFHLIYP